MKMQFPIDLITEALNTEAGEVIPDNPQLNAKIVRILLKQEAGNTFYVVFNRRIVEKALKTRAGTSLSTPPKGNSFLVG